ncbi:MAG: site-2 protease family protein [Verrucomicrobia bacterium]|nr:site-2 protease family protein [Verrucomicrobiota bacterium]
MEATILNFLLAGLGLSFLIFIHELGHYWMARRVGMKVEVFSIGFGKPLLSWQHDGVKWQIGALLFGGYVKIAGMESEEGKDSSQIPDGFYGKSPLARIKVVFMGPFVNIVFALMVFTLIWGTGGRKKPFEQETHIIGWVDPSSELSSQGVKAGDTISSYNGKSFTGFKDLLSGGILSGKSIEIKGDKVSYFTGEHTPYDYDLKGYQKEGFPKEMRTIGVLNPASILVFERFDKEHGKASPLYGSGIADGDRILWANGELIFSASHLYHIINQPSVYVTIERNGEILRGRVPRVALSELEIKPAFASELSDWRREFKIAAGEEVYFIPYEVDAQGFIGKALPYIDNDLIEELQKQQYYNKEVDITLKPKDRIVAVEGVSIQKGSDLLKELKEKKILLMTAPTKNLLASMTFENQDRLFVSSLPLDKIKEAVDRLEDKEAASLDVKVLRPSVPITYKEFIEASGKKSEDRLEKAYGDKLSLFLGTELRGADVFYNPTPIQVFKDVLQETYTTFSSLLKGNLSPKWLTGPVGMVKIMHDSWSVGFKEALYWMGLISLHLGVMNLLPLPVLDGGHILFSLWEIVTRKRIASRTVERMVIPFAVLLIIFVVYITYQDLSRLFTH